VRRVAIAAAAVGVLAAACQWVLPERYAVNVPLRSVFGGTISPAPEEFAARIRVPDGFAIGHWATDLPGVRFLRFTDAGDLLASVPGDDRIEILWRDDDGDGVSDGRQILLADLDRPHGIDLYDGWLYVGETGAVGRIRFDAAARATRGSYQRLVTGIPTGGHWTRTVRVGPDAKLYVSIGSSCNVCAEADPRRAAIVRYALDGSQEEIYATGLRNAVGFDWQPNTGALYATDNGRDLLGDDFPPCELDRVVAGGFYGWPYVNGFGVPDPDWGDAAPERVRAARPPAHGFPAHTAPLGLHFVRSDTAPPALRGAALAALHGSWNRTEKAGYKVVSLHWSEDGAIEQRDFVSGFEIDDDVIGRPVDVAEGPDGAIYVSDDYAGAIYRVVATGNGAVARAGRR